MASCEVIGIAEFNHVYLPNAEIRPECIYLPFAAHGPVLVATVWKGFAWDRDQGGLYQLSSPSGYRYEE
jgi:hypothetical protein